MSSDYNATAYEKTIFEHLRKYLEEKFMPGGGGVKEVLICEDVTYSAREVPTDAIASVILRMDTEARNLAHELNKYAFKREDVRPIARVETKSEQRQAAQPAGPTPPRGRRAPKQGGEAGGSQ